MISKAMLMTAGLGTRLRPFTDLKTKALLPVMGVPCAQFAVDSLVHAGVETIVANVHHGGQETMAGILALSVPGANMILSDESSQLLGSAGGIQKALPHFGDDPFFLANADVVCDLDWHALEMCHQRLRSSRGVSLTLAVFPSGPTGSSYREILFDSGTGLISALGSISPNRPFYVGAAVLERDAFNEVSKTGPADFVQEILEPAVRARKAGVFFTSGSWFDIGTPALWLGTHLSLMKRLEVGYFPNARARLWAKRLENANFRRSEGIWVGRESGIQNYKITEWAAPSYWASTQKGDVPPKVFGPQAVLYGSGLSQDSIQNGIGYGGSWSDIPEVCSF